MWIDSGFPLFGPERATLSARLCCSLISHIFHDCVGYCTANHMCYPLSCAVAMSYIFFVNYVHALLYSSLGYT